MLKSLLAALFCCTFAQIVVAQSYYETGKNYDFRSQTYVEETENSGKSWVLSVSIDKNGNASISRKKENSQKNDLIRGLYVFGDYSDWKSLADTESNEYALSIVTDADKYWLVPFNPADGEVLRIGGPVLVASCPCKNGECTPSVLQTGNNINATCVPTTCTRRCGKMDWEIRPSLEGIKIQSKPEGAEGYLLIKATSVKVSDK